MARNIDKTCKIEDLIDDNNSIGQLRIWLSSPILFRSKTEKDKYIVKEIKSFLKSLNIYMDFSSARADIQLISIWWREQTKEINRIDILYGAGVPRSNSDFILPTEEFKDFIDNIIEYQIKTFNGKN
jgi:hypothetical protein